MKHVNNGRAFKMMLKYGNVLQKEKERKKHKQILIASLQVIAIVCSIAPRKDQLFLCFVFCLFCCVYKQPNICKVHTENARTRATIGKTAADLGWWPRGKCLFNSKRQSNCACSLTKGTKVQTFVNGK